MSLILDGTLGLSDVDGSASTPAIRGTDSNTGVFFATDIVGLATGGTERMRIDSSGNVGIGTNSPANRLHVVADNTAFRGQLSLQTVSAGNFSQLTFYDRTTLGAQIFQGYNVSTAGLGDLVIGNLSNAGIILNTNNTERMRITAGGAVGIGTSNPGANLQIGSATFAPNGNLGNNLLQIKSPSGFAYVTIGNGDTANSTSYIGGASGFTTIGTVTDAGSITEHVRVTNTGNVGIGTTSPQAKLHVSAGAVNTGFIAETSNAESYIQLTSSGGTSYIGTKTNGIEFLVNAAGNYAGRFTSAGRLLVNTTNDSPAGANVTGLMFGNNGEAQISRDSDTPLFVNRKTNDGTLVNFLQDANSEGSISVSGNTVSYNAFAGSHWSQLSDGSKPEILRGTVMESINELVEWEGEPTSERLCRVKISDTASSKKVYGVFMCWDNDWTATNDMLVTSLGAFICRINKDVVVQEGDLLESNGDGTARVQSDNVMRSSTIGKVTCTVKTHEYADGSYCVPTVLYCG